MPGAAPDGTPDALARRVIALGDELGCEVSAPHAALLGRWLAQAATWNAKLDLTAARGDRALVEVLTADAIVASRHELVSSGARVLDVGAGSGAPGLALAILRPDLRFVLLEPIKKRVAFLRSVVGGLALTERVTVREGRIDADAPRADPEIDVVVSRATFAPDIMARVGLAIAPATLLFLVDALPALPVGARITAEQLYRLPTSGAARRLARVERGAAGVR